MSYLEKKVQNGNEAAKAASRETKNTINTFPKLQLSPGGRGSRDQIANIRWIIKKAREFQINGPLLAK